MKKGSNEIEQISRRKLSCGLNIVDSATERRALTDHRRLYRRQLSSFTEYFAFIFVLLTECKGVFDKVRNNRATFAFKFSSTNALRLYVRQSRGAKTRLTREAQSRLSLHEIASMVNQAR